MDIGLPTAPPLRLGRHADTRCTNREISHEIPLPSHAPEFQWRLCRHARLSCAFGSLHRPCDGKLCHAGATVALGLGGALSKLLALPVFCLVVFLSRLICLKLQGVGRSPIRPMLLVKLTLFTGVAIYALYHGPFRPEESIVALLVGMALVSAMAIQNGLHKAHLPKAPPSTLMTGTTTQIMLDLADLFADPKAEEVAAARARIKRCPARSSHSPWAVVLAPRDTCLRPPPLLACLPLSPSSLSSPAQQALKRTRSTRRVVQWISVTTLVVWPV